MKIKELGFQKEAKSNFLSLSIPEGRHMGKVHSVFRNSFNIELNGQLINISRIGMSLSAHGCVIDSEQMEMILKSIRPGDIVRLNNSVYSIYTKQLTINVDTSKFTEVDLSIPDLSDQYIDIEKTSVYQALKMISLENEIGLEIDERTQVNLNCLERLHRCETPQLNNAVNFLIGRGKGLTPSGDDLLVGYALTRKVVLRDSHIETVMKACLNDRRTTDISEAYYKAYLEGFVSSHLRQLMELLESLQLEEAKKLIYAIGQYGHTSGYDSLYGCYLGLESIINERRDYT